MLGVGATNTFKSNVSLTVLFVVLDVIKRSV